MNRTIEIDTGRELRRIEPNRLPLVVGGAAADIALPGIEAQSAVAFIGLAEDQFFVQSGDADPVLCNGSPVKTSQWLYDGDVVRIGTSRLLVAINPERLRITVQLPSSDNLTVPPSVTVSSPSTPAAPEGAPPTVKPVPFQPAGAAAEPRQRRRRRRPLLLLLWLALLPLVVFGWFVLTARSVEIVVEPKPDHLEFRAGLSRLGLNFGGRHLVRPGSYPLVAEKEGFRPLEVTVEVTRESNQSHRFTMRRLPGLLVIDAGGVEGALASVDGEPVGETPLQTLELEPGEHELRISSARYEKFVTTVAIEGGGTTQSLAVELVPRWAPVTLASRPPGATIRANGEELGVTPATLELIEGAYTIEFDLAGHKGQRRRITVEANTPQTVPTVTLQLTDGRLTLRSEPAGATVSVDDIYRGVTPLELYLPPGRDHRIELSKAGHETVTRTVSVRSGRTTEEQITLPALRGEITVKVDPAGAELIVDGTSRGEANQTLSLVAVPHEIEVRKAGHEGYRTTVTPRPGVPQLIDVTLKSAEQLQAEATPPRLRSPQGQDMILVQGGRFMMGASRREPGRRSNETMHEVELTRPFYIATKEVSNGEFREFKSEHLSGKAGGVSLEADHHPVVRVKWSDAALYCNWLSQQEGLPVAYEKRAGKVTLIQPPTTGYRLPTEAEWAFVARYPNGKTPIKYAWGDTLPPPDDGGNYGDESAERLLPDAIDGYDDHYPGTAPVDSFKPNPLGLYNLGGNVAEWVNDYYSVYPSRSGTVERDPTGPTTGTDHVIRGAGWMDAVMSELRLTYRDQGSKPRPDVGFRVARYAE